LCLGIPAKVVKIEDDVAIVNYGGVLRKVDALLVPDIKEGDFVIVHAGAIIAKINEKEAKELISAWQIMLRESKLETFF